MSEWPLHGTLAPCICLSLRLIPTLSHPPKLLSRRSRSEAARSCNPTGATWASARTDRPLNSKAYASAVLAAGPSGHEREDSSSGAPPARAWDLQTADDGGAGGRPQTLVVEGALGSTLTLEGEDGRDGVNQNRAPSEALYSWNPGSAIVSDDCVDDTRDELLAPPDPGRGGSTSRASAAARTLANRAEARGGGGALLEGSYEAPVNRQLPPARLNSVCEPIFICRHHTGKSISLISRGLDDDICVLAPSARS